MSDVLPLLPITIPSACTPSDAIPKDAIPNEAELLGAGAKLTANILVVADGATGKTPDLAKIAPVFAKAEYGITDPGAVRVVASWQEFDALMRNYATINVLALLVHDRGRGLEIGGESRSLRATGEGLAKPEMPKISSMAIDGCGVALDVNGMLLMVDALQLYSLTAWPLLVGFAPVEVAGGTEAAISQELTHGAAHILGPKDAADAVRRNLLVYSWLQTTDKDPGSFPGPESIPVEHATDPAAYRADHGFLSRANANTYTIPKQTPAYRREAVIHTGRLADAYMKIKDREPGSETDPYQYLYQVIVM